MTSPRRALLFTAAPAAGLLLLHEALIRRLAEENVVGAILAAGPHTPVPTLALAVFFVLLRFFVLFVLPGLLVYRLGLWCVDRAIARAGRSPRPPGPPP